MEAHHFAKLNFNWMLFSIISNRINNFKKKIFEKNFLGGGRKVN